MLGRMRCAPTDYLFVGKFAIITSAADCSTPYFKNPVQNPMTVSVSPTVQLANFLLGIKPLFALLKGRARSMMIKRAETMGVQWRHVAAELQSRDWQADFDAVNDPNLTYPAYYLKPFHAYNNGNLGWEPATEVELAAYAVHARIWEPQSREGDPKLRESFNQVLREALPQGAASIVDLGCSVGMSTFALQDTFEGAEITGVDLSPYFLAVARDRSRLRQSGQGNGLQLAQGDPSTQPEPKWVHAAAESTGLPARHYDLVAACLVFHELPGEAAIAILTEAKRLLKPGGTLAIMDMNPQSAVFGKMPPYILTLLKSTEPYLDQYFALDVTQQLQSLGFSNIRSVENSPRHRTILAVV
jgi:ubiquinone/menaquinone biosynthesis C-methylase UbiE